MVVPFVLFHLVSEMGLCGRLEVGSSPKNEACGLGQGSPISGARLLCKVVQLLI